MGIIKCLENTLSLGYEVGFKSFATQLIISIKKRDQKSTPKESWLPLDDHFNETKIVGAICFMIENDTPYTESQIKPVLPDTK